MKKKKNSQEKKSKKSQKKSKINIVINGDLPYSDVGRRGHL